MNSEVVVSLIALAGFLILALSGLKERGISLRSGTSMAVLWVLILGVVALVIGLMIR
jgi:phosphate/sulfate permease